MQLNPIEMRVLEGVANIQQPPALAFQLPTINAAVPNFVEIVNREVDYTTFARALVEANVITPEMIGENACTPKCILEQGLRAWFKERTDRMQYLKFDVELFDAEQASDIPVGYESEPTTYKNWVFGLSGYETSEVRVAQPVALELEKKCPGLFYTAFSAMEAGGWMTTDILTPIMIIEQTASFQLWEGDFSEMPSDEEAWEGLLDRYGEAADQYLPSVLMEVWGEGFCFARKKGQITVGKRKLKKLSKSPDKQVAMIAHQVLKVLAARQYVEECGAEFNGPGSDPLFTACSIGFNRDERYTEFIDSHVNHIYECGEYSEYLTLNEFPSDLDELESYFIKLDALFRLMAEVDALVPLLSIGDADM